MQLFSFSQSQPHSGLYRQTILDKAVRQFKQKRDEEVLKTSSQKTPSDAVPASKIFEGTAVEPVMGTGRGGRVTKRDIIANEPHVCILDFWQHPFD